MKLSKKLWRITAVAVFTLAVAGLGVIYFQRLYHQEQLGKQLAQVQTNFVDNTQVTKLILDKAALTVRLEEGRARLETVKGTLTSQIEGSAIVETLFEIAEAHNMEITELTSVPSKQNLAGVDFSAILLTVGVKGSTANVIDFVVDLNDRFRTGVIGSVALTILENPSSDGTIADIRMTIYSYQDGI